ncbi:antitoxin Xre/MbcA/ParS toxin-binding domain-containing protein [Bosea sp. NPDC003192]|uniref:antitoxin Xre/MbcA/ParS toxin-binding domain-containing protein n=1 Tax=Bosea sp. NPDC003192 TaxID=3390551 RepID=UPI003D0857CD
MTDLTREECELLLRTAIRILSNWQVRDEEGRRILGDVDEATYADWRAGRGHAVPTGTMARCAILIGIHKGLRLMFRDPARGYAWMSHANKTFGGATPIATIASGNLQALRRLRDYVAAQSQLW